ncbi:uncharacterized protein LOC115769221 [Drosophila novamexicana]|uniref:uncharacterized protein LOC115769221 n=1 Tax=Drosophila novamexicana TaxID=47314 RepID=UPI0011E5F38F|nr:uncharacterized protein LOC115769221 [Drosophila novamexicana]
MWKFVLISVLSLLPCALLQDNDNEDNQTEDPHTTQIYQASDSHLCTEHEVIFYTLMEPTPLREYGFFADHFRRAGIRGSMRRVTKTRLEPRPVCCPGYLRAYDNSCQPVSTTTEIYTELTEGSTLTVPVSSTDKSLSDAADKQSFKPKSWLMYGTVLILILLALGVCMYSFYYIKQRKDKRNENGNEIEEHSALFCE